MTCPFCGAKWSYGEFSCGFVPDSTEIGNRTDACYKAEIEKLREKKAQGLEWQAIGHTLQADYCQGVFVIDLPGKGNDDNYYLYSQKSPMSGSIFDYADHKDPLDAAKAHAEELHQQAWRELRERWDFKGGGK